MKISRVPCTSECDLIWEDGCWQVLLFCAPSIVPLTPSPLPNLHGVKDRAGKQATGQLTVTQAASGVLLLLKTGSRLTSVPNTGNHSFSHTLPFHHFTKWPVAQSTGRSRGHTQDRSDGQEGCKRSQSSSDRGRPTWLSAWC